jgi:crossover junction endodeoxyribonuclease RuvC
MEKLFFTVSNQANAEFVYAVRGIVIDKCMKLGIRIIEYTPIQIKKAITGNGKATKILVQTMIMHRFSLVDMPAYHDAADALGLAYMASKV